MKKTLLFFFLLAFLFATDVSAQNGDDYKKYMQEAANRSLLYRGKLSLRYDFAHQGTYFAYSPTYEKGMVHFNGKDYYDVLINLNSNIDEVCVKISNNIVDGITLNKAQVDYFFMGKRKFVNFKQGNQLMVPGYYEVIYSDGDGMTLYKKISTHYREDISRESSDVVVKIFESTYKYFLVRGESVTVVKNDRTLISLFRDRKKEIKQKLSQVRPKDPLYTEKEVMFRTILQTVDKK